MDNNLEILWKDLLEKARIKEENVVLKELEKNSVGAVNILVVESTGKGAIVITQAYSVAGSNLAIDINRIYLPQYRFEEIAYII